MSAVLRGVSPRDYREVLQRAADLGCEITVTRNNHLRVLAPGGIVFASQTSSDRRATRNLISQLRRAGVPL